MASCEIPKQDEGLIGHVSLPCLIVEGSSQEGEWWEWGTCMDSSVRVGNLYGVRLIFLFGGETWWDYIKIQHRGMPLSLFVMWLFQYVLRIEHQWTNPFGTILPICPFSCSAYLVNIFIFPTYSFHTHTAVIPCFLPYPVETSCFFYVSNSFMSYYSCLSENNQ